MAFVNEYIPEEDKKKHNMTADSNFYLAGTHSWTVDRDKDMFLLPRTGSGPESTPGVMNYAFYWRGHLLDMRVKVVASGGDARGGHGWERTKLLSIAGLPPGSEDQRAQLVEDFRDALVAQKGLGVYSRRTSYEVTVLEVSASA